MPPAIDRHLSRDNSCKRKAVLPNLADKSEAAELGSHAGFVAEKPWMTFLLPFIVYMMLGSFEPSPPKKPLVLPDGSSWVTTGCWS